MTDKKRPPDDPFTTAKQDLRWYFEEAEGALGARAQSYEGSSGGVVPEEVAERQAEAYLRSTRVRRALEGIPLEHARVLALAFTPLRPTFPLGTAHRWYDGTGAIAGMLVDPEDVVAGARRVAALTDQAQLGEWRAYAEATLAAALTAYLGRTPRHVEPPLMKPPRLKVKEAPRTWVPMAEHRPDEAERADLEDKAQAWARERQATRRPSSSDR